MLDQLDEIDSNIPNSPETLRMFGTAGKAYLEKHVANPGIFGKVAVKTREHAVLNPYLLFNHKLTTEEVTNIPVFYYPTLTRLMTCPPTCGVAAVISCTEIFARKNGVKAEVGIISNE